MPSLSTNLRVVTLVKLCLKADRMPPSILNREEQGRPDHLVHIFKRSRSAVITKNSDTHISDTSGRYGHDYPSNISKKKSVCHKPTRHIMVTPPCQNNAIIRNPACIATRKRHSIKSTRSTSQRYQLHTPKSKHTSIVLRCAVGSRFKQMHITTL